MSEKVAILGASLNPERFSYKAFSMLQEYGHDVYPVNPGLSELRGKKVFSRLSEIPDPIDTVTLYVNPSLLQKHLDDILKLKPRRVIFNPGTEDQEAENKLSAAGIAVQEACTLVLLRTRQYDKHL